MDFFAVVVLRLIFPWWFDNTFLCLACLPFMIYIDRGSLNHENCSSSRRSHAWFLGIVNSAEGIFPSQPMIISKRSPCRRRGGGFGKINYRDKYEIDYYYTGHETNAKNLTRVSALPFDIKISRPWHDLLICVQIEYYCYWLVFQFQHIFGGTPSSRITFSSQQKRWPQSQKVSRPEEYSITTADDDKKFFCGPRIRMWLPHLFPALIPWPWTWLFPWPDPWWRWAEAWMAGGPLERLLVRQRYRPEDAASEEAPQTHSRRFAHLSYVAASRGRPPRRPAAAGPSTWLSTRLCWQCRHFLCCDFYFWVVRDAVDCCDEAGGLHGVRSRRSLWH